MQFTAVFTPLPLQPASLAFTLFLIPLPLVPLSSPSPRHHSEGLQISSSSTCQASVRVQARLEVIDFFLPTCDFHNDQLSVVFLRRLAPSQYPLSLQDPENKSLSLDLQCII